MYEARLDKNHPSIALCHMNMGAAYFRKSDYKAALKCFTRALNMFEARLDKNHPDIALCHKNIGEVHAEQNDYETAIERYNTALTIYRSTLDENHPRIVRASALLHIARERRAKSSSRL